MADLQMHSHLNSFRGFREILLLDSAASAVVLAVPLRFGAGFLVWRLLVSFLLVDLSLLRSQLS